MLPLAFGFASPADTAIVVVVLLIIFGPKRLPQVSNELGQAMREMRKIADGVTGAVSPADKVVLFVFLMALIMIILLNAVREG